MAEYDYKAGKKRVKEIIDNKLEIIERDKLPSIEELTFENAYQSWVTAVFVDIRDSTSLFTDEDKSKVSKIVRGFTSEIIEILRGDDLLREIGIRGDCVYAVYTSPKKSNIYDFFDKAMYVNTYMKMLNELLRQKTYPKVKVGIGMGTAKELVVKAGRKGVNINNPVWIGDAVTKASKLSALGNKNNRKPLVISELTYSNMIESLQESSEDANVKSWFTKYTDTKLGTYYCADLVKSGFNKWIADGMKD